MPTGKFHSVAAFIDVGFLTAEGARTLQVSRRSVKPECPRLCRLDSLAL